MFNIKFYTKLKIILLNIFFLNNENIFKFILKNHKKSNSQIFQDLFVLYYTKNKKNGFFIEIGGGNGFDLSNTYLLEKKFKWDGIICEPNVNLQKNISELRSAQLIKKPITKRKRIKLHAVSVSRIKIVTENSVIICNFILTNHL